MNGPPGRIAPAKVATRIPENPELGADPAADGLARQEECDEFSNEAAGENLGKNIGEQAEILGEDLKNARAAVLQPNLHHRGENESGNDGRGPVESGTAAGIHEAVRSFQFPGRQRRNDAALCASAAIAAKSPAATASLGATQEPPTATTLESAR